jgi:lipoprotein NlpD
MTRRLLLLGCCVLQLTACGTSPAPVEELPAMRHPAKVTPVPPGYHQVKRGDTLYSIAFQYGYSYEQVAAWNAITAPYVIRLGQRLRVMPPGATTPSTIRVLPAEAAPSPVPAASPTPTEPGATSAAPPASSQATSLPEKLPSGPLRWNWPCRGKLLHGFDPDQPGGKGIDIGGRLGQDVTAAADGWVVYSGSGLMGYGQLLIVKHDKSLLSAYGHNGKLLVKEGDAVRAGQVIAAMGENGTSGAMLHFEIRRDGKPVDPLEYLPRH